MKKALNIALDLQCEEELINVITRFIKQKRTTIKNVENKNIQLVESDQIMDPLVTKHHGRPSNKRLKSSSENQNRNEPAHTYRAINPRDVPFSNVDMNSHAINNNAEELCRENKRKYVCTICGEAGHNARTYFAKL
ncbi:hypothetical protein C2G38_2314905 [Gigaspora rosea]|uniref:CCHC-type domain-containing protein n=1 Tax=Gigaspora rosea TaxID=44941 RepID=A0A397VAT2_9GLOM|nr:hypothetical protein C2G38_2314905 [Gigaspora rosea]